MIHNERRENVGEEAYSLFESHMNFANLDFVKRNFGSFRSFVHEFGEFSIKFNHRNRSITFRFFLDECISRQKILLFETKI